MSSLEPSQLRQLVTAVRDVESAMGSGEKRVLEREKLCYEKVLNKKMYSYYI